MPHLTENGINSASYFQFYNNAMSACLKSHEGCRETYIEGSERWLPSRLIQIDPSQDMRLMERGELRECNQSRRVEYFTLSHVWGTDKFLTLTTQNMDLLKHEIQLAGLPKCFQEAVMAARRLGGRYLWIDSLW